MLVRIACAVVCVLFALFVMKLVARGRLLLKYSILWFVITCALLAVAIWPDPIYALSDVLGFLSPSNFLLLLGILCLLAVCLSLSVIVSGQASRIARLNQRLTQLDRRPSLISESSSGEEGVEGATVARPLSIAIFSAQFVPHIGGVETFSDSLSAELARRGHNVLIVTNDTEGLGSRDETPEGVEVIRLPCFPLLRGRLPMPRPCAERSELLAAVSRRRFDAVLVNTRFYPHSLLGMKIAKNIGLRPIVLDHGSAYLCFNNPVLDCVVRAYENAVTLWGRRHYDPVYYGISQRSVEWLDHFGIKARGMINNSIDADSFEGGASRRDFRLEAPLHDCRLLVAVVGRLVPEKGIVALLKAAKDPALVSRGVCFAIAGSGPLEREVRSAGGNVLALGPISKGDVAKLLIQADLYCLPSRSEGFSTSLLEAAACGCPSVVTDVGGARELIPDVSYGTILPDMSAKSIVGAISCLADNPDVILEQSMRCRELVRKRFSWGASVDQLLQAAWDALDA